MKTYAQIVNNKVHGIFNYDVLPEFDNTIVMVDITGRTDIEVGMVYDGVEFTIPPLVTLTLDEQKLNKIKELQNKYQETYDVYLSQYPKAEVATFEDKKREALAYNLDNTIPTPIIDNILSTLGGTKDEYVASILAKVTYLAQQEGVMVSTRDAIKACTTQAELDAIVI